MSNTDIWFDKLEKVIEFMTKHEGKRPSKTSVVQEERSLSSWLNDQLKFYKAVTFKGQECGAGMWVNEERSEAWTEFMNKFEDSLLSKEEIWDKKLYLLDQYIALHKSKPSENGTDDEVAILRWSYDQVKRVKPGTDRHVKWQQLCQKYPEHFQSYEAGWNETYDEIVAFVQKYRRKPSQDGADEDECRLSRWMTRQNMSLSRGELAEDRVVKWEWFCMEYGDLQSTSVAKASGDKAKVSVTKAKVSAVNHIVPKVNHQETLSSAVEHLLNKHKKCKGRDRNGDPCRNYTNNGELYCKRAHAYLAEYTDEQIEKFILCKGCLKWKDIPANRGQCASCDERGKKNRKEARVKVVLCKSEGCTFQKSDANDYCGKHQICVFVDSCRDEGVRPCRRYLHGCRAKLAPNYGFSSCSECLELERKQENARRHQVVPDNVVEETKQCTVCTKWKPLSDYQNKYNSNVTLTCLSCRDDCAIANSKRDMEHIREIQRIASHKPERKAAKQAWADNNPEKIAHKLLNHRNRVHDGSENLSEQDYKSIVSQPCYYCNMMEERGFNSVDRLDSNKSYELSNCVSSCIVCNLMKGATDPITFAQRVEHILTYNKLIDGRLFPNAFSSCNKPYYKKYVNNANERNYCFELSQEDFDNIINDNCYICGKENCYGIDRYDNSVGYILSNVKPCCGQCNIMKKTMEYQSFLVKLQLIYTNISAKHIDYSGNIITHVLNKNTSKLTPEQIREKARIKKQKQREAQKQKVENIVAKKTLTIEEKREKERIKKQKQRDAKKAKENKDI